MIRRVLALLISFCLIFEQAGFAQVALPLGIPGYLSSFAPAADKFRPVHLRAIDFNSPDGNIQLILDKGDNPQIKSRELDRSARELYQYFQIGLVLPNKIFWVNLRPDSPDEVIEPVLARTDIGRIMLEADLQLKKDLAMATSPQTPEGKLYWHRLYARAGELYSQQDIEIPTLTRPWIVPAEALVRSDANKAFIYKATLKVMLEQDYLKDSPEYNFRDPRQKELNAYSSQLIRELIIPRLTREVNSSKKYAQLRQVYYSLILAQWFKRRNSLSKIDSQDLKDLTSSTNWEKDTYFQAYRKSFQKGEYNAQEQVSSLNGINIRRYFSGGMNLDGGNVIYEIRGGINVLPADQDFFSGLTIDPLGNIVGSSIQRDGGKAKELESKADAKESSGDLEAALDLWSQTKTAYAAIADEAGELRCRFRMIALQITLDKQQEADQELRSAIRFVGEKIYSSGLFRGSMEESWRDFGYSLLSGRKYREAAFFLSKLGYYKYKTKEFSAAAVLWELSGDIYIRNLELKEPGFWAYGAAKNAFRKAGDFVSEERCVGKRIPLFADMLPVLEARRKTDQESLKPPDGFQFPSEEFTAELEEELNKELNGKASSAEPEKQPESEVEESAAPQAGKADESLSPMQKILIQRELIKIENGAVEFLPKGVLAVLSWNRNNNKPQLSQDSLDRLPKAPRGRPQNLSKQEAKFLRNELEKLIEKEKTPAERLLSKYGKPLIEPIGEGYKLTDRGIQELMRRSNGITLPEYLILNVPRIPGPVPYMPDDEIDFLKSLIPQEESRAGSDKTDNPELLPQEELAKAYAEKKLQAKLREASEENRRFFDGLGIPVTEIKDGKDDYEGLVAKTVISILENRKNRTKKPANVHEFVRAIYEITRKRFDTSEIEDLAIELLKKPENAKLAGFFNTLRQSELNEVPASETETQPEDDFFLREFEKKTGYKLDGGQESQTQQMFVLNKLLKKFFTPQEKSEKETVIPDKLSPEMLRAFPGYLKKEFYLEKPKGNEKFKKNKLNNMMNNGSYSGREDGATKDPGIRVQLTEIVLNLLIPESRDIQKILYTIYTSKCSENNPITLQKIMSGLLAQYKDMGSTSGSYVNLAVLKRLGLISLSARKDAGSPVEITEVNKKLFKELYPEIESWNIWKPKEKKINDAVWEVFLEKARELKKNKIIDSPYKEHTDLILRSFNHWEVAENLGKKIGEVKQETVRISKNTKIRPKIDGLSEQELKELIEGGLSEQGPREQKEEWTEADDARLIAEVKSRASEAISEKEFKSVEGAIMKINDLSVDKEIRARNLARSKSRNQIEIMNELRKIERQGKQVFSVGSARLIWDRPNLGPRLKETLEYLLYLQTEPNGEKQFMFNGSQIAALIRSKKSLREISLYIDELKSEGAEALYSRGVIVKNIIKGSGAEYSSAGFDQAADGGMKQVDTEDAREPVFTKEIGMLRLAPGQQMTKETAAIEQKKFLDLLKLFVLNDPFLKKLEYAQPYTDVFIDSEGKRRTITEDSVYSLLLRLAINSYDSVATLHDEAYLAKIGRTDLADLKNKGRMSISISWAEHEGSGKEALKIVFKDTGAGRYAADTARKIQEGETGLGIYLGGEGLDYKIINGDKQTKAPGLLAHLWKEYAGVTKGEFYEPKYGEDDGLGMTITVWLPKDCFKGLAEDKKDGGASGFQYEEKRDALLARLEALNAALGNKMPDYSSDDNPALENIADDLRIRLEIEAARLANQSGFLGFLPEIRSMSVEELHFIREDLLGARLQTSLKESITGRFESILTGSFLNERVPFLLRIGKALPRFCKIVPTAVLIPGLVISGFPMPELFEAGQLFSGDDLEDGLGYYGNRVMYDISPENPNGYYLVKLDPEEVNGRDSTIVVYDKSTRFLEGASNWKATEIYADGFSSGDDLVEYIINRSEQGDNTVIFYGDPLALNADYDISAINRLLLAKEQFDNLLMVYADKDWQKDYLKYIELDTKESRLLMEWEMIKNGNLPDAEKNISDGLREVSREKSRLPDSASLAEAKRNFEKVFMKTAQSGDVSAFLYGGNSMERLLPQFYSRLPEAKEDGKCLEAYARLNSPAYRVLPKVSAINNYRNYILDKYGFSPEASEYIRANSDLVFEVFIKDAGGYWSPANQEVHLQKLHEKTAIHEFSHVWYDRYKIAKDLQFRRNFMKALIRLADLDIEAFPQYSEAKTEAANYLYTSWRDDVPDLGKPDSLTGELVDIDEISDEEFSDKVHDWEFYASISGFAGWEYKEKFPEFMWPYFDRLFTGEPKVDSSRFSGNDALALQLEHAKLEKVLDSTEESLQEKISEYDRRFGHTYEQDLAVFKQRFREKSRATEESQPFIDFLRYDWIQGKYLSQGEYVFGDERGTVLSDIISFQTRIRLMKQNLSVSESNIADTKVDKAERDGGKADPGGIDFRQIPESGEAVNSALTPQLQRLAQNSQMKDLDKEWTRIRGEMLAPQMPYDRIKEYIAVCLSRPGCRGKLDQAVNCIIDILRMEEDQALATDQELKDILTYLS